MISFYILLFYGNLPDIDQKYSATENHLGIFSTSHWFNQCTANVKSLLPLPKPNKYTNQSQLVVNDEIYLLKDIYCKIFKREINIDYLLIWIVYAYICQFYLMLFKLYYILIYLMTMMIQINAVIDSKTQEFLQVKSETGSGTWMVRRDQKKETDHFRLVIGSFNK